MTTIPTEVASLLAYAETADIAGDPLVVDLVEALRVAYGRMPDSKWYPQDIVDAADRREPWPSRAARDWYMEGRLVERELAPTGGTPIPDPDPEYGAGWRPADVGVSA